MFIIIEVIKETIKGNEINRYVPIVEEQGFLVTFQTEEQASDYIETIGDVEANYQIVSIKE